MPARRAEIYRALCLVLSERMEQVDWGAYTPQEWALFARMAEAEGVAPLIHYTFQGAGYPAGIPDETRQSLALAYYSTAAHNALLFRELERILAALAAGAEIPVIVLKGAALAQTVYPDPALRPMGDLDLLVHALTIENGGRYC